MIALLLVLALTQPAQAMSAAPVRPLDCHEWQGWFDVKAQASQLKAADFAKFTQLSQTEWASRNASDLTVYQEYVAGTLDPSRMSTCLSNQPDRGDYLASLQSVFYAQSVAKLRAAQSPAIQRLVALLDQRTKAGKQPLFRLTGQEFNQGNPAQWDAGFYRAVDSIYADFGAIPHDQWLLIFVHETLHGLDDELSGAIPVYGNRTNVKQITAWASQFTDPSSLSAEQLQILDTWLEAGLSRGLWAEYRAWVPSFVIYQQGLAEGLWPKIDWVESVLAGKSAGNDLKTFVYSYIDSRSPDPTDGLFSTQLVQKELSILRGRYKNGAVLPEFGNLQPIAGL